MEVIDCKDWLANLLKDGEYHLCDDVRDTAKKQGFKRSELKAARKELRVKTFHQFDEDGPTPNHFWYLEV